MEPASLNDMRTPTQTGFPQRLVSSEHSHNSKKLAVVVGLIVLGLIVALWFVKTPQVVRYDEAGNAITEARAGKLIKDFPEELIREKGVTIDSSYSITYSAQGKTMPFARYISSENYQANVDGFRRLLQSEGWVIQKDGSVLEVPTTSFYATKDGSDVNIVLNQETDAPVVVQISYLMSN